MEKSQKTALRHGILDAPQKMLVNTLQTGEYTPAVRASNAISLLDEILQDPNMPPYTRVKLWNVMSFIEAIKD